MTVRQMLEGAKTEIEERQALAASLRLIWPDRPFPLRSPGSQAMQIINGPRAGWIGVPLLAMPEWLNKTPAGQRWRAEHSMERNG